MSLFRQQMLQTRLSKRSVHYLICVHLYMSSLPVVTAAVMQKMLINTVVPFIGVTSLALVPNLHPYKLKYLCCQLENSCAPYRC